MCRANDNGKVELRMHHVQFPNGQMQHYRIFHWLHRQHSETRYEAGWHALYALQAWKKAC